jgi:hypothetical protein
MNYAYGPPRGTAEPPVDWFYGPANPAVPPAPPAPDPGQLARLEAKLDQLARELKRLYAIIRPPAKPRRPPPASPPAKPKRPATHRKAPADHWNYGNTTRSDSGGRNDGNDF